MTRAIGILLFLTACLPTNSKPKADNFHPWKEFAKKGDILIACKENSCKSRQTDNSYKLKVKNAEKPDLPVVKYPQGNRPLAFDSVVNKLEVWRRKPSTRQSISASRLDSEYSNAIDQLRTKYERVAVYDLSNALVQNNFNPAIFCDAQIDDL
jgi:hypothetical protein